MKLQVTLFDANHCTGAVMFLFEDKNNAVLYTGDIRSEPWFVNNLVRNPLLLQYTTGVKTLDCIYLDTSNLGPLKFPTKAEGLRELLEKVSKYPNNTRFHFAAWTFGYEEVWMALSQALGSQIHVDKYKMSLYQSLRGSEVGLASRDGPMLVGYKCGNEEQKGCLTTDKEARIHSCEKGLGCDFHSSDVVFIRPIVTRTEEGIEIAEVGIGGGMGDLHDDVHGVELDRDGIIQLLETVFAETTEPIVEDIRRMLLEELQSARASISISEEGGPVQDDSEISLTRVGEALVRKLARKERGTVDEEGHQDISVANRKLPKLITFPYSRHSSCSELQHLVGIFKPKDVFPCTVDEENWHEGFSIEHLFGDLCSGSTFRHDAQMRMMQEQLVDCGISQQTGTPPMSRTPLSSPSPQMVQADDTSDNDTHMYANYFMELPVDASEPSSESRNARLNITMADDNLRSSKRRKTDDTVQSSDAALTPSSSSSTSTSRKEDDCNILVDGDDALGPAANGDTPADRDRATSVEMDIPPATIVPERVGKAEMYWDEVDSIYRCETCQHEIWSTACLVGGFCTGCGRGHTSYVEDIALDLRPRVFLNEYDSDSAESDTKQEIQEEHLDYQTSAYDTQDEDGDFDEDYEQNSFIDDEVVEEPESEEDDNDEEMGTDDEVEEKTDFKQAFENIQKSYQELLADHSALMLEHDEMKRDFLGSDYEEDEEMNATDIINEEGMHVVDAERPEVRLAEVVVSSSFRGFDQGSDAGNSIGKNAEWKGKGKAVMREASKEL
ncbi:hypothetical protein ACMFMG_010773 [Clarireedia jacksonii]